MSADPIKCLAAAHMPILRGKQAERMQPDWFAAVDRLATDIRRELDAARADERTELVNELRDWMQHNPFEASAWDALDELLLSKVGK